MFLMNISNTAYDLERFGLSWHRVKEFMEQHRLDGLEFILHGEDYLDDDAKGMAKGLHLKYFPTWLEFYKGAHDKLEKMYKNQDEIIGYYGGSEPWQLIRVYKDEYRKARALEVEYMVYHVGHVTVEHAFTFDFDYDDEEVMDATADIVNKAFDEDSNIELLFENLWWPGMTLLDYNNTKRFLDKIEYKNKGIMLDLSHLLITNHKINDLAAGTDYILEVIDSLKELKGYIKGIHVNMALPGDYMLKDHREKYDEMITSKEPLDQYIKTMNHIKKMDWHVPYDHIGIQEIIKAIEPKYVVYEVLTDSIDELSNYIDIQNKAIGR